MSDQEGPLKMQWHLNYDLKVVSQPCTEKQSALWDMQSFRSRIVNSLRETPGKSQISKIQTVGKQ